MSLRPVFVCRHNPNTKAVKEELYEFLLVDSCIAPMLASTSADCAALCCTPAKSAANGPSETMAWEQPMHCCMRLSGLLTSLLMLSSPPDGRI